MLTFTRTTLFDFFEMVQRRANGGFEFFNRLRLNNRLWSLWFIVSRFNKRLLRSRF
ncbi:hypothetical protein D3C75_716310 [compost metagenome]